MDGPIFSCKLSLSFWISSTANPDSKTPAFLSFSPPAIPGATKLGHNWTSSEGWVWAQITFVFVNQLTREFTALLYYTVFSTSTLHSVVSLSLSLTRSLSQHSTFVLK